MTWPWDGGGLEEWESAPTICPSLPGISVAAFPIVGWVIVFPKSALDSVHLLNEVQMVSVSVWSLPSLPCAPQNTSLHVPDEAAEPVMPREILGAVTVPHCFGTGHNARTQGEQSKALVFCWTGWKILLSLSLTHTFHSFITVHLLYLEKSSYFFSHAKLPDCLALCYKLYPYLLPLSFPKEGLHTIDRKAVGLQLHFKLQNCTISVPKS